MADLHLTTPVALFVYNRPDKTRQVLEQISEVKPETFLVVADGPSSEKPKDAVLCERTRDVIRDNITWECDVLWNTASENLGLKERFVTGLKWIFEREKEAIILEDDCLPSRSFFQFCMEMLKRYRHDDRIMDIGGTNYLGEWKSEQQDYHFSLHGGIWGWATWRRAWERYDPEMELWMSEETRQAVRDVIANKRQADYVEYLYDRTYHGKIDTWDYQWGFARHINSSLSVVPSVNLVTNIGFDANATNTDSNDSPMSEIPRHEINFPIEHRDVVAPDRKYDARLHKQRPLTDRSRLLRTGRQLYERIVT